MTLALLTAHLCQDDKRTAAGAVQGINAPGLQEVSQGIRACCARPARAPDIIWCRASQPHGRQS